ncbi:Asp-tRNA(Asn)/Glu-tRNA(Gln) amidotransferase subunit GatC [Actinotalea subterranea]|uniref:Asp-tRNA(Asn)/Glu-tRNA(Gln) amidotransferase subunit GatC n=1 Tax=Actinotalea subterranea TaxID=2607497 RepID=UPI0011EFF25D|nr:Asp-tRNA(Asn)/Glu-tRNA(Gln) amidotransferase subunit GatC [Actinotalea subterranea]
MSTISREEVARLAGLARIDLTEPELNRLAGELDVIVESVARVSEVATSDVPATSHPLPLTNVFREDVVEAALPVEDALAGAPSAEGGRFAVPQILEED